MTPLCKIASSVLAAGALFSGGVLALFLVLGNAVVTSVGMIAIFESLASCENRGR